MLSYPKVISLRTLTKLLRSDTSGRQYYIVYINWGCKSIESMIKSVPDCVCLHEDKVRNMKIVKRVPQQLKGPSN